MLSLGQIQREALKQAKRAAARNKQPIPMWSEDLKSEGAFMEYCAAIPFFGDYVPKGWHSVDPSAYISYYPYRWFFVDASGLGKLGEPALTVGQLYAHMRHIYDAREGQDVALVVAEAGEFQVHVALLMREAPALPNIEGVLP